MREWQRVCKWAWQTELCGGCTSLGEAFSSALVCLGFCGDVPTWPDDHTLGCYNHSQVVGDEAGLTCENGRGEAGPELW